MAAHTGKAINWDAYAIPIRQMAASGKTQLEISKALDIGLSSLNKYVKAKGIIVKNGRGGHANRTSAALPPEDAVNSDPFQLIHKGK